jgi:hypothetical protein
MADEDRFRRTGGARSGRGSRPRRNISPREQLEAAVSPEARRSMQGRISDAVYQRRRSNLEGGLRSLTTHKYNEFDRGNPYLKDKLFDDPTYTGFSWPGGRERYLSRHTNPEALYRQNKEIYPQYIKDYWEKNPSKDPRNPENEELYEKRYTEGMQPYNLYLQNINTPKYEGYTPGGGYEMFKEGFPVEGWNEYERDKQRLGAEFGLGEFSGTEFPPRPLPYDASEFAGTPVERYQPTPGTEYSPMEHIDYDALHLMNPADAGEFGNDPDIALTTNNITDDTWMTPDDSRPMFGKPNWKPFWDYITGGLFKNRGGLASLRYER